MVIYCVKISAFSQETFYRLEKKCSVSLWLHKILLLLLCLLQPCMMLPILLSFQEIMLCLSCLSNLLPNFPLNSLETWVEAELLIFETSTAVL